MKLSTKNLLFITLISSLFLLILVLIKQQNYFANTQTLALTDYQPKAVPPITAIKNKELSCSDCTAQGKDTICFNVEANRATCGNADNSSQNINTLCRKCSIQRPKPTIFVTPIISPDKCYYIQRGDKLDPILVCPSISPKPTISQKYCLQVITPARNIKTKECKTFSNSCIPEDWMRDSTCSTTQPTTQYIQ